MKVFAVHLRSWPEAEGEPLINGSLFPSPPAQHRSICGIAILDDKLNAVIRNPHDIDRVADHGSGMLSPLGPRGIASILRLLAHINVFIPEPM
jgi:hypothetical protein